jgi:hypothetical protein
MAMRHALRFSVLVATTLATNVPLPLVRAQVLPGNAAAARLRPIIIPPAQPAARDQLPLDELKLPPGF